MTPKEQAAMQQALIYLDAIINGEGVKPYELEGTAFTLREALDNSLKPKCFADYQPNHAIDRACASCAVAVECQTGEQAEQEPVAWTYTRKGIYDKLTELGASITKSCCNVPDKRCGADEWVLQTVQIELLLDALPAPVRTKDLSDDEIEMIFKSHIGKQYDDFARAVIAADREKNK